MTKTVGKVSIEEAGEMARKGRPTKYRDEFPDQLRNYFDVEPTRTVIETIHTKGGSDIEREVEVANDIPTLEGFAAKIGVSRDTLHEWATALGEDGTLKHIDFSDAYKNAREQQERMLVVNAMAGRYAPAFSIFYAKNKFGYRDKQELDANVQGSMEVATISFADALKDEQPGGNDGPQPTAKDV